MKKWSALLLALLMVTMLLTGCGEQDPEKVAATVVAEVNGQQITKGEAEKVYEFVMNQTVYMNAQYGYQIDTADKEVVSTVKTNTLNVMAEGAALEQKLAELGLALTDEERQQVTADAKSEYDTMVESFVSQNGVTEEEAKTLLDSMGYSEYAMDYMIYREEVEKRLSDYATTDVTVTDEEIEAKYKVLVDEATAGYVESPDQFVTDVLNEATIYAQPEGFRYIKNLVIGFPEEIDALIDEKDSEYFGYVLEQYSAQNELSAATDMSDEDKAELEARIASYEEDFTRVEAEIEALKKQGFEQMKPQADEIVAKAKEPGADFDALIAEYSIDKPAGTTAEKGYPVAEGVTNYVASFTEGAMAMQTIGEIAGPIESDYGYHILMYAGDVQPGPASFDDVKDTVAEQALSDKQVEVSTAKLLEWIDGAKIKTYINRF